jgi:hypothetical protein
VLRPAILVWVFLILASAVGGTTVLHYTLEEAVATADEAVRGHVTDRQATTLVLPDGASVPVVRYRLQVAESYFGEGTEGQELTLLNPGGPVQGSSGYAEIPSGFPDFRVGEEVLVLLEKREGRLATGQADKSLDLHPSSFILQPYFVPVGLGQGKYVVTRTEDGEAYASRGPIGARVLDRRSGEEKHEPAAGALPLLELEAQIRAAIVARVEEEGGMQNYEL